MKTFSVFLLFFLAGTQAYAQKDLNTQASNLNASKSNINRIYYSNNVLNPSNAQLLLNELDKVTMDEASLKLWLPANFKRFGIDSASVKHISVYSFRQYADCTVCKQNCKGRCVQDPGADCICYYHSEPNLRLAKGEKTGNAILLSQEAVQEENVLNLINAVTLRATTVKSSKSNSSD